MIITGAFILQTRLGKNQWHMTVRIGIAGLSSAILSALVAYCIPSTLAVAIFVAITTLIAVSLSRYGMNMAITAFFVNLLTVISATLPQPYR